MSTWSQAMQVSLRILLSILLLFTAVIGVGVGLGLSEISNLAPIESYNATQAALPSRLLDINGRLITQFFDDEKRELLRLEEMPKTLIHAILTREDKTFFEHNGFSISGIARAAIGIITGNYSGGGSTITQQVAGRLFADRTELTLRRKLIELWYAFQIERQWTKYQILEEYLNGSYFGHNTYGVESASQFYFGHSARDLSYAEAAILVIQLAAPGGRYSPIRNPNSARTLQRIVLDQITENGFASQEEVDASFEEYWANYDYSRSNLTTAYYEREDLAPYFSEYVRQQLQNEILLGSANIYRDGYTVYTTLNLDYQQAADSEMLRGISEANRVYQENIRVQSEYATSVFSPGIDLLSLAFNLPQLRVAGQKQQQLAKSQFMDAINPALSLLLYQFSDLAQDPLRRTSQSSLIQNSTKSSGNSVEGALITLDNETGYILAMVGGTKFDPNTNSFNRATQSMVQPGSTFKPLYYSAAIERGVITPATMIYDSPVVFWKDDGTPYMPQNYRGEWSGPVLARTALSRSMNVPSIRVLDMLGFDDAIAYSSRLNGVDQKDLLQHGYTRNYTLGLGVVSLSPLHMARAYATFANQGVAVTPIAIKYVEDRFGRVVAEPERQLREAQARSGNNRILTPQTAFLITDMLESTVGEGTLRYPNSLVGGFHLPMAGKTGTTQNWRDLWTLGYSPYYSTAVWIGFDSGNRSMGTNQTGAVTAGPIWARYMKQIHDGLPYKDFVRPSRGIVEVEITARSGLLPPPGYSGAVVKEYFLEGTQPREYDTSLDYIALQQEIVLTRLDEKVSSGNLGLSAFVESNSYLAAPQIPQINLELELDLDILAVLESHGLSSSSSSSPSSSLAGTSLGSSSSTNDPTIFDGNLFLGDNLGGAGLSNPYLD